MTGPHPRLDWHLDNWARYQRGGGTKHLGCKTQSLFSSGSSDFDTMADRNEAKFAITMDTLVWDLPEIERIAVHHKHLQSVWRTNREPMESVYARARLSLSAGLVRRGIT